MMKLISRSIDFGCASMAPSWPCEKGSGSLAPPGIRPFVLTRVNTWFHLFSLIYVTVLLRGQVVLNLLPLGTNNHLLRSQATRCRNEFSFSLFFFWKLGKKTNLACHTVLWAHWINMETFLRCANNHLLHSQNVEYRLLRRTMFQDFYHLIFFWPPTHPYVHAQPQWQGEKGASPEI